MRRTLLSFLGLPLAVFAACTATDDSELGDGASGVGGSTEGAGGGSATGSGGFEPQGSGGSTSSGGPCNTDPSVDDDMDGFSEDEGDCNDCDANVNPDAVEVIGDSMTGDGGSGGSGSYVPVDEDCDGTADEEPTLCDANLAANDIDPMSGAAALDLCEVAGDGQGWGVVKASYVRADGTAVQDPSLAIGLLPSFGDNINPQNGDTMVGLSSGHARPMGHPEECGATSCSHSSFSPPLSNPGTAPPNFPQNVPDCPVGTQINDDIGLELEIEAPSNAKGYRYDFAFLSFEFPEYVCTQFNDQYIALVNPAPQGSIDGNISFDANLNPVSVNIALFDHCDPDAKEYYTGPNPPSPYCPLGETFMDGTGFNTWDDPMGAGSTGWLVTTAPIEGGETFTIRFAIWDTSDTALDSTVLIDNFHWSADPGTSVGTDPIPDPK